MKPGGLAATDIAFGEQWTWKSWISSANELGCDFPLQNLPFCVFDTEAREANLGCGIGDFVLDLHELARSGLVEELGPVLLDACKASYLNALMRCGREANSLLRLSLMALLREDASSAHQENIDRMLSRREATTFRMPVQVGNYTDFYASIQHAANVGRLFRPDQPLLPNYKFIPIAYHGRASSLIVSGTPVTRPQGQIKAPSADIPSFGITQQLDYELEVGAYIGHGNGLGNPIPIREADAFLFGVTLLNDWSARDIQAWEYQPLGPFLGKSFATSVSPWVVTMDALRPFRVPLAPRLAGDPEALPYLTSPAAIDTAIDLKLEVHLSTGAMRKASQDAVRLSCGNVRDLYWSFAQMVTHHTSNGCNLLTGDLLGSGTVSGFSDGSRGSLLEITRCGAAPLTLPTGEKRSFLEDGDEVILRGYCQRAGLFRIGLGECRGTVVPARV